jgi:hypothetical protein
METYQVFKFTYIRLQINTVPNHTYRKCIFLSPDNINNFTFAYSNTKQMQHPLDNPAWNALISGNERWAREPARQNTFLGTYRHLRVCPEHSRKL